jgi:hypothetical protein
VLELATARSPTERENGIWPIRAPIGPILEIQRH